MSKHLYQALYVCVNSKISPISLICKLHSSNTSLHIYFESLVIKIIASTKHCDVPNHTLYNIVCRWKPSGYMWSSHRLNITLNESYFFDHLHKESRRRYNRASSILHLFISFFLFYWLFWTSAGVWNANYQMLIYESHVWNSYFMTQAVYNTK